MVQVNVSMKLGITKGEVQSPDAVARRVVTRQAMLRDGIVTRARFESLRVDLMRTQFAEVTLNSLSSTKTRVAELQKHP
jgi:hypothetical protein